MEKIWEFVKSLPGWQKIVGFIAVVLLALVAMFSCTAQRTLHMSGTVENATFEYDSDGKLNIR
uniref:Uncharacterized protein n=1 Tax=Dulem virus 200 TaxID=3145677 RepID=A0AAU8B940_9VIRU